MGVSIEVWRGRIGLFAGQRRRERGGSEQKRNGEWNLLSCVVVAAVILALLSIGNVEPNPGPPCKYPTCGIVPETIASSVRHQHYHSNDSNFMFYCPSTDCMYFTKSFNALNFHVSQFHRLTRHHGLVTEPNGGTGDRSSQIHCLIEGCAHALPSFWNLVQHLISHLDSGTQVPCPVGDCDYQGLFKKTSTFRVHLSQYHKGWRDEGCPAKRREDRDVAVEYLSATSQFQDASNEGNPLSDDEVYLNEHDNRFIFDKIAKFYLQLYAEYCLPYSTIQEIANGLTFISEITNASTKKILEAELTSLGVEDYKIRLLTQKVLNADALYTTHHKNAPGPSLTSDYLRRKWFKTNYNFQEPMEVNLSDNPDSKDKLQYVPLTQTLLTLFEDPTVQKDIDESFVNVPSNGDEVSDYTEGSQFQAENHQPQEIHLHLYQDAYNPVMNALGSAKNKYKQLVVYFTLGNLKRAHRSKIDAKHLVLMVRESIFKKVGAKKCFEKLMSELKKLQEGIIYKGRQVKVKIVYMLGDSLGQHMVGGFIECFNGLFFCRFCDIKRHVFKSDPTQTNPQRSKEDYNLCVLRSNLLDQPCKGIKDVSVFNDLENFHAVSHLPPCIAHDLFEGVVSWDLSGIIRRFVDKKWFTYKLLNRRIRQFKCKGIDGSNKPAFVRSDGKKLGGHAIQNWTLLRLLPFLIGDKIKDFDDPGWKQYLQLKELCEFFCAQSFLKSECSYVRDVLLPLYFMQRAKVLDQTLYPLKPKHHFMVHYPELMLRFGPLIYLWTLGFEQKHKFFKHLCRISGNFRNVEYTCAVRHQMSLAYLATGPLFPEGVVESNSTVLCEGSYHGELKAFLIYHRQIGCRESTAVTLDGVLYQKGSLILLSPDGQDIVCGLIKVILCSDSGVTFVLECFTAIFNSEVGLHVLPPDATGRLMMCPAKGLKYAQPQPVYEFKGKMSFSVKGKVI